MLGAITSAAIMAHLRYRHDIAKLTIQITSPDVTTIKRDIKITFSDQLGVIGKLWLDRSIDTIEEELFLY